MGDNGTNALTTLSTTLAITRLRAEGLPDGEGKKLVLEVLDELQRFLDLRCTVPGPAEDVREQLRDQTVRAYDGDGDAGRRSIVTVASSVPEKTVDEMQESLVALGADLRDDGTEPSTAGLSDRVVIGRSNQLRGQIIGALAALEGSWPTKAPEAIGRRLDEAVRQKRGLLLERKGLQLAQRFGTGLDEIEHLKDELRETVRDGKEAVAKLGEGELAEDFSHLARHEGWESRAWQVIVALVLVLMAWSSSELIAGITDLSWMRAFQKLAVSLPLAALAVFAGAEAKVHRHRSMWARSTAVQLRTVGAFTAILPKPERDELRMALGRRVFDKPAELPRRRADAPSAGIDIDVGALDRSLAPLTGLADGVTHLLALLKRTDTRPDEAPTSN